MKIFKFDLANLSKEELLKILGVGLVTVSLIAGLASSGQFLRGTVPGAGDPPAGTVDSGPTLDPTEGVCGIVDTNLPEFIVPLNNAIGSLNNESINLEDPDTNEALIPIAISIFSIEQSISMQTPPEFSDCFAVSINPSTMLPAAPELVELLNLAIININRSIDACADCESDNLTLLNTVFTCNTGRVYDSVSKSCIVPVPDSCGFQDEYEVLESINDLLLNFRSNPSGFGRTQLNQLEILIEGSESESLLEDYLIDFDYEDDAEQLSIDLNSLVTSIQGTSDLCEDLDNLSLLIISRQNLEAPDSRLNETLNGDGTSCPANSIYDDLAGGCYCPLTDDYLSGNERCAVSAAAEAPQGVICADGTVAVDQAACELEDTAPDEDEDEDIDDEFDFAGLPGDPVLPEIDFEDEVEVDEDEEIVATTPSGTGTGTTLISNTNANVMGAGIVQGDTGPKLFLALLIGLLLNLGYIKARN